MEKHTRPPSRKTQPTTTQSDTTTQPKTPLRNLRHHFATTTYDRTKDILLVMQKLGHKKIETTMLYTQLVNFNEDEEYTCKTASNVKETTDLIEHGFQYVTEIDGLKLFKKRK